MMWSNSLQRPRPGRQPWGSNPQVITGLTAERKHRLGAEYHDQDLICCEANGDAISPNAFSAAFRSFEDKAVRDLALPRIRFHDIRHSHCSHLLHLNLPLKLVSERLGHSSIAITADLYGHILEGQEREAADLLETKLLSIGEEPTAGNQAS
jgi:integrase